MRTDDRATVAATAVELARNGRFEELEQLFAPELRALVSAETVRIGWSGELSRVGPILSVADPVLDRVKGGLAYVSVAISCERGGLVLATSVDDDGRMHGLRLTSPPAAPWQPPSYADPRAFTERAVTLRAGRHPVPGTITVPTSRGRHPAVVLLSGGGAFDRDETAGSNKVLKDLAWGLATRGVASLRFDKVTVAHGDVTGEPGYTATDEYVPHAVAAVRLLQRHRRVDPARVFVAGHSLGGRVAPRVAAAEASVAGLIILAGDTQPMQQAVVRVARHIVAVSPGSISAEALASLERQAALVDSPALSSTTPGSELPFNWPGAYWLDLRADDPVARAAALGKPMLILQGARDYQVTAEGDLAGWRAGLGDRPDAAFRVYDADDHMFFPGTGTSKPADYEPPQHVDPAVVSDIADWLGA